MAGTAKAFDSLYTISGPMDIWFKLAVPGAGAATTLFTDGTPDATENATAKHAGMLKTGGKVEITAEIQERTSDNLAAPYASQLLTSAMSIGGDMLQFDADLLALITPGATKDTTPPTGYTGITLGSLSTITYTSLAGVVEQKTAGKYYLFSVYNGYQANGFNLAMNRNEDAAAEVSFKGVAIGSRATVDQTGALWRGV